MHDILIAIILGMVEGVTEFVPISSTGHLIVVGHMLGFTGDRAATFEIFIQLGAILAVAVILRERIFSILRLGPGTGAQGRSGLLLVILTSIPAGIVGLLLNGPIKQHLFSPTTVAIGWGLGGVALLLIEHFLPPISVQSMARIRPVHALGIGLSQCLSLWPGVSRSASTIGAGMVMGIDRKTAAEYSFLAGLPLITAATLFDLIQNRSMLHRADIPMFAVGFLTSFLAGWIAVRFFLNLLNKWTLRPFAWYRIVASLALLGFIVAGKI
ncbi:MAG: undecaprenyl-diphosphate phosphatase [Thermomicrobiales bacterium]|nr:undecaprenyl-diphosphate phosphatase [Thermomicrobiales bacterium]